MPDLKRTAKIILIGVCLGLILLLFKYSFGIDDTAFMHGYWIAAIIIVSGAVFINLCYNFSYLNKVRKIVKLLSEEKPQEYIAGIEQLLDAAKRMYDDARLQKAFQEMREVMRANR